MQLSRQTFRWVLVLSTIGNLGCLPTRKLATFETWRASRQPAPHLLESAQVDEPPQAIVAAHPVKLAGGESGADSPRHSDAIDSLTSQFSARKDFAGAQPTVVEAPGRNPVIVADIALAASQVPEVAIGLEEFESIALANNPTLRGMAAITQKAAGFRT